MRSALHADERVALGAVLRVPPDAWLIEVGIRRRLSAQVVEPRVGGGEVLLLGRQVGVARSGRV